MRDLRQISKNRERLSALEAKLNDKIKKDEIDQMISKLDFDLATEPEVDPAVLAMLRNCKSLNCALFDYYWKQVSDGQSLNFEKNAPKRFIEPNLKQISIRTEKNGELHGLALTVSDKDITVSVNKAGKQLVMLRFKEDGKEIQRSTMDESV